jgi:hypothetical protein
MTFYYPWYGIPDGPGGAGRTVHWGRIDKTNKDIAASTHYPELGPYDSHDPNLIDQHCRWAKGARIDTFIVSWWGHGDYTDKPMTTILDACRRHGLTACIYYETVPRPQIAETAAQDIVKVLAKYGSHPAHLRVNDKPVVFIYGRALQELGLTAWLKVIEIVNKDYPKGFIAIGDQFSFGAARVFDGLHTYNTAGSLKDMSPADADKWASGTYQSWVQLTDAACKISAVTVIPGYDDTKIRTPGLAVQRHDAKLYRAQWENAIKANPHWVLITSFNEWHEGSELEPSIEFGRTYLDLTTEYATRFKAKPRISLCKAAPSAIPADQIAQLSRKLQNIPIAVLSDADSMAFWWLLDLGIKPEILSWQQIAAGALTPQKFPLALYCAGEHYRRTVNKPGDVDDALVSYLRAGGTLIAAPSLPWPFYYDENGSAVNSSARFGLTIRMGWEQPPKDADLKFVQPQRLLPHIPREFPFPASGDLRWRGFVKTDQVEYTLLLQLRDAKGNSLGDAVAYASLKDGGHVLYVWFALLNGQYAEPLLYDVFDLLADRSKSPAQSR